VRTSDVIACITVVIPICPSTLAGDLFGQSLLRDCDPDIIASSDPIFIPGPLIAKNPLGMMMIGRYDPVKEGPCWNIIEVLA
jgi:hypothetical protein